MSVNNTCSATSLTGAATYFALWRCHILMGISFVSWVKNLVHNFMVQPKGKLTKTLQRAGEEGVSPGGLGEGTLMLSYICTCRLGLFLRVQNLKFNILGAGFRKMIFFFGGGGGMIKLRGFFSGGGGYDKTEVFFFFFFLGGGGGGAIA